MLSVEHVTKRFGTFTALEDVSLMFEPGVYGLVAPNGARQDHAHQDARHAVVSHRGPDPLGRGGHRVARRVVPARLATCRRSSATIPPTRRASSCATWPPCAHPAHRADPRIDELLETVGIAEVADKKMRQFSGGMLQRVGIAQAMVNDPELLILDEPTSGLDPRERVRFRNLVHALAADRIVILSTHIVSDVETIAGQIVMFRDHRLHCCDSASNICAQLQDRVFEVPANMALAPGQLLLSEREGAQGPVLRIASDEPPAQGTPVAACLEDAFLYIYGM